MLRFGGLGTVLIVGFLFWSLMASNPGAKMERACKPVDWFGNMTVSLVAVTAESWVPKTAHGFDKVNYTCQYMLWRLFYEKSWQKAVAEGRVDPETGRAVIPGENGGGGVPSNVQNADRSGEQMSRPIPYPMREAGQ